MKLSDIKPNPNNPRVIKDDAFEKLCNSIKEFPKMMALRPMVVDQDNVVLGGNMRLKALQHLGFKEIPDTWVRKASELTEEEKRRFIIADNVSGGEWDWGVLQADWDVAQLEDWGLDIPDYEVKQPEAVEDDYEIPDEIETDIVLGDLFEIGEHRLLCGDSTDSDTVAKLMNGEKADMVFTDPPYGVNIKGGKNNSMIAGDITQTAIPFGFDLACTVATKEDARIYFCGGEGNIGLYHKLFEKFCRQLPRHLIWVKNGFVMKPNGYHNQYEIIFHGYKPKGGGLNKWFGGRTEHEASDVWRINRDASSTYEHPTQKPIALPERAIKNSCPINGLVYEPFTGSGSTMVAAHQLKRKCYGMELDPKYCQVIIDRMIKLDPDLKITRNGQPYENTEIKQKHYAV
jgi:DNA modification methylase